MQQARRWITAAALLAAIPAYAGELEDARAFFDDVVRREQAFDPSIGELYAPDARILTTRDGTRKLELSGAEWQKLTLAVMPMARERGDTSTYDNVRVAPQGERYRITAVRTSTIKCSRDPQYHMDVARIDGQWRIVEEYTQTVSLPLCPPSGELRAALEKVQSGIRPQLPMDLDEDTRLVALEVAGQALIYNLRLVHVTPTEFDATELNKALQVSSFRSACLPKEMRALLDAGATIRYSYFDKEATPIIDVDVSPGLCQRVAPQPER